MHYMHHAALTTTNLNDDDNEATCCRDCDKDKSSHNVNEQIRVGLSKV